MFDILLRWLKGYLIFGLSGDAKERFMKLCRLNDIFMWNSKKKKNKLFYCVCRKDLNKLESFAKKTNCTIDIKDKRGLPYFMYKYKKRKCFIIGIFIFLCLIIYSNGFIWKIKVSGSALYTEEEILNYVKNELVKAGTKKEDVDCNQIEFVLREKYNKIAWISCYINGTELNIEISDTIEPDKIKEVNKPCDIVAVKDCVVVDMITKSGVPVVKKDDTVKKGDVLITGRIEIYNDYDELTDINYVSSDGFVYGETVYNYYDSFELRHYEKEYTGNEISFYSLSFGDKMCTPYIPKIEYLHYDVVTDTRDIKINDTYTAPVSFYKTTIKEYTPVPKTYTDTEALEKAEKRLNLYVENLQKKGVEILRNNVKIEVVDGKLICSGTLISRELVGIPRDIDIYSYEDKIPTTNSTDF